MPSFRRFARVLALVSLVLATGCGGTEPATGGDVALPDVAFGAPDAAVTPPADAAPPGDALPTDVSATDARADTAEAGTIADTASDAPDNAPEPPEVAQDVPPEVICTPSCDGAQCGPDGCGGTCGDCDPGKLCSQGTCIDPGQCTSTCEAEARICGPDGCGSICGYCTYPEVCDPDGQCVEVCVPFCEADNKHCGPDGCGGTCGDYDGGCQAPLLCGDDGQCYQPDCIANCIGKLCGNDGCGGDCGLCAEPKICQNGSCQLGPCGTVTSVGECQANVVVWCSEGVFLLEDDCDDYPEHACKYDGFANAYGCQPVGPCTPKCEDKECGSDSCGGWCAPGCPAGWSCLGGACAPEPGGDCGGEITTLGECIDNVLWFCSGGLLYFVECDTFGQTCTWDNSQGKYGCL